MYVYAGDYAKDIKQAAGSKQGAMASFVHKVSAVSSCSAIRCKAAATPQGAQSHSNSQTPVLIQELSADLGKSSTVRNKRSARDFISIVQQQTDAAKSNQTKLPRKGIGPMDRFLR